MTKYYSDLSKTAKLDANNIYLAQQSIENAVMGQTSVHAALRITARTDQNQYSRPSIYLDCYGSGGCLIFFDTDGKLRALINDTYYTIAG